MLILLLILLLVPTAAQAQTTFTITNLTAGPGNVQIGGWNTGITYNRDDLAVFQHNLYISQINSNLDIFPSDFGANAWRTVAGTRAWSETHAYSPGDIVTYQGTLYVASISSTGVLPGTISSWTQGGFPGSPKFTSMGIGINPTDPSRLTITPETSTGLSGVNMPWTNLQGQVVDISQYSTNNRVGIFVNVKQDTSPVGVRSKTGIAVASYQAPDNGGEVSGIYVRQNGGGNAISLFKGSNDGAAGMGQTAYPLNGFAMEIQSGDATPAIFATTGNSDVFVSGGPTTNGQVYLAQLGQSGSRGIIVVPRDGVSFDTRAAYEVGNFDVNASVNAGIQFQVRMNGAVGVGQVAPTGAGQLSVLGLKTTGSASGKKVVCVDTSTGQLYASSTGTDCSN